MNASPGLRSSLSRQSGPGVIGFRVLESIWIMENELKTIVILGLNWDYV